MQKITLHSLPEPDQPWTIEEFLETTEEICRLAAVDLYRKSMMVEEAVEEVLDLVKNAAENFKSAARSSNLDIFDTEGEHKILFHLIHNLLIASKLQNTEILLQKSVVLAQTFLYNCIQNIFH